MNYDTLYDIVFRNPITLINKGDYFWLPKYFGEEENRIFVSLPRNQDVIKSMMNYQQKISNLSVGYGLTPGFYDGNTFHKSKSIRSYNDNTRIIYVDNKYLYQTILSSYRHTEKSKSKRSYKENNEGNNNWRIDFTDIIMIEDRDDLETILFLALWRYAYQQQMIVPRLIIIREFIDNSKDNLRYPDAYQYLINQPISGGEIEYLEPKVPKFSDHWSEINSVSESINNKMIHFANNHKGSIVLLVPTSIEAESIYSEIRNKIGKFFIKLYQEVDSSSLDRLKEEGSNLNSNFYIVARSHLPFLTGRNINLSEMKIDGVFDTMYEKRRESSKLGGIRWKIVRPSHSEADGISFLSHYTYRNITLSEYQNLPNILPEINRLQLDNYLIDLVDYNLNPIDILSMIGIPPSSVNPILNNLSNLNLILNLNPNLNPNPKNSTDNIRSESISGKYQVSPGGKFIQYFPLSVLNATGLYRWAETKNPLFPGIAIFSMIDSYGPYVQSPYRNVNQDLTDYSVELDQHIQMIYQKFGGESDLDLLCNIWNQLMTEIGGPNGNLGKISQWALRNSLIESSLYEAVNISNICTQKCQEIIIKDNSFNDLILDCEIGPFTCQGTMKILKPILANVYSNRKLRLQDDKYNITYLDQDENQYRLNPTYMWTDIRNKRPVSLLALLVTEIRIKDKEILRVVSLNSDLPTDTLIPII